MIGSGEENRRGSLSGLHGVMVPAFVEDIGVEDLVEGERSSACSSEGGGTRAAVGFCSAHKERAGAVGEGREAESVRLTVSVRFEPEGWHAVAWRVASG